MILLLAFVCLSLAGQAKAAEVFIDNGAAAKSELPAKEKPVKAKTWRQNESAPAINDFANRYYHNCLAQRHPVLAGEDLKMLCACTSAKVSQTMTVAEIQSMGAGAAEGMAARNKMLTEVYAPCIEYPAGALIRKSCLSDPSVQALLDNPAPVCNCVADQMSDYVGKNAQDVVRKAVEENPETTDPLSSFLASEDYDRTSKSLLSACLQKQILPRKR